MVQFIIVRLLQAVLVLLIIISITFFVIHMAPGGAFDSESVVYEPVLKTLNEHYHLDLPVWRQLINYLSDLVQGDFGLSYRYPERSVNEMILSGLPATIELVVYAIVMAIVIGSVLAVVTALNPHTCQSYITMAISMAGICMPALLLGPLLILVFGITLEWLPISGWGDLPGDKILPSLTLGTAYMAYIARFIHTQISEVMSQDYIRTARAKGLSEWQVMVKHGLYGGLIPMVAFLGPAFTGLLVGVLVVETIFQIPGIGRFYVQAVFNHDYTMIMGSTIIFSVITIGFNLVVDILKALIGSTLCYPAKVK